MLVYEIQESGEVRVAKINAPAGYIRSWRSGAASWEMKQEFHSDWRSRLESLYEMTGQFLNTSL